mgnify:CR=1 FL=1
MNKNFKTILYFIIVILIISAIFKLFIKILPYMILLILALWIISKVNGYINRNKKTSDTYSNQSDDNYSNINDDVIFDDDFEDPSKAIDVDYEEVDDKK